MKTIYNLLFLPFFILSFSSFSQDAWISNPLDQKAFIENKGQFSRQMDNGKGQMVNGNTSTINHQPSTILFGSSREGLELYFTAKGLTYTYNELMPRKKEGEKGNLSQSEKENEEKEKSETISHYFSIEWIGANPDPKIIAEEPVSFYYTYGGTEKDPNTTTKANAYKKITYKNLYPNIDLEYFFLTDSNGIKYSLILHPGADPEAIKMKYGNAESISLDHDGNILIKSSFGEFKDHAPKTFYKDGTIIKSSFELSGNTVSFKLDAPPLTINHQPSTIIIDPWITNPSSNPGWTGSNSAYDVNYDLNGNVYIFGSSSPFRLAKLNSAGVIQWVFTTPLFHPVMYGDFAVDEVSGTSYMVDGYNLTTGSKICKVNTLGIQTGIFMGNPNLNEMWRAEYNRCINKIVIAAGGTSSPNQAAVMDTNLLTVTPINVLSAANAWHDMHWLALDNIGTSCYMAVAYSIYPTSDNLLIKCPIPNLIPLAFSVPDGYAFKEKMNVTYVNVSLGYANGMNGMAVSPAYLYTYDSYKLKRWNKNTGALVSTTIIPSVPPVYDNSSGYNALQVFWGGLAVDECDNVYVGDQSSIKVYNSSLALVNTFPLPNTVYDVKLGVNNKLYACGKGFVSEINIPANNTTVIVTQTPASGCGPCDGTATVSALSCSGNAAGFNYLWSTSPAQTTQTATGLCPGNYTVTLTTNCFITFIGTITVTGGSGSLSTTATAISAACGSNNGSATVNITGGTAPFTYNWNNAQTTQTATGLAAGNYTVTVFDASGCSATQTVIITQTGGPTVTTLTTPQTCTQGGTATASATGGSAPYTYSWCNGQTTSTATGLSVGTCTVIVTDINNCSTITTVTITSSGNIPVVTATSTPSSCNSNDGTATATVSGGTSPYTYLWTPSAATTATATGLSPGNYSVMITDATGCTQTATVAVTQTGGPTATALSNVTITQGQSATLTASGGGTYLWSNGSTNNPIVVSPPVTTIYCVTVTDANNCTDTACVTVTVFIEPIDCSTLSSSEDFFIPNAFSPNGDNENDVLELYYGNMACIKTYKFVIYNRWGEKVYESENPLDEWDGTWRGKMEGSAVFAWYMKATLITGEEIIKKGNVSLVK